MYEIKFNFRKSFFNGYRIFYKHFLQNYNTVACLNRRDTCIHVRKKILFVIIYLTFF